MSYTFAVASDTFDLAIAQTEGELVVKRAPGASATAEAAGVSGTTFLVLPRGLRVEGPSAAGAVYTIELPARVSVVRLQRANTSTLQSLPAALDLHIDLRR